MIRALGLDLSKARTGWAMDPPAGGVPPQTGSLPLPADLGRALHEFAVWLNAFIKAHQITHVGVEAPAFGGPGIHIDKATVEALVGLATHARSVAWYRSVQFHDPGVSTVRKYFVGSGRAQKRDVMDRCRLLGWEPANHDEGDAAAVWAWLKAHHDKGFALMPPGPLLARGRVTA